MYIHERILPPGEIKSLHSNPYQILKQITKYMPIGAVAATGFQAAWARNKTAAIGAR